MPNICLKSTKEQITHIHGLLLNMLFNKHAFIFLPLKRIGSFLFFSHIHRLTLSHIMGQCLHVRKKDVLPLSLCRNEPWHPALTAALRQSGLKLEPLTGADGPARSQAPLGLEWKYHYHINHGCAHMDHSLCTKIMVAVCLSLSDTIVLNSAPFCYIITNKSVICSP